MDDILGFLSGAGISLGAQWLRYDQQTQDRLRNTRADVRDLRDAWIDQQTWGNAVRDRLPIVQDFIVGLALASAQNAAPSAIPTFPGGQVRPNLCQGAENAIRAYQFPPRAGQFDARQNVQGAGEITPTVLAFIYEEVRAAILALVVCSGSTPDGRVQIYRAINSLVETVHGLGLTKQQFLDIWARFFGSGGGTASGANHTDPAKPPTVVANSVNALVSSVVSLNSQGVPGYPFGNPQTDRANRWRLTVGAANIPAGNTLFTVRFGSSYQARDASNTVVSVQPVVHVEPSSLMQSAAVTADSFSVVNTQLLTLSTQYDIFVSAVGAEGA